MQTILFKVHKRAKKILFSALIFLRKKSHQLTGFLPFLILLFLILPLCILREVTATFFFILCSRYICKIGCSLGYSFSYSFENLTKGTKAHIYQILNKISVHHKPITQQPLPNPTQI